MHYQFARFAPCHPELFFHHWAKPLYVLIASPAAQFGITGIKIFNLIISSITVFVTWKIAKKLQIKRSTLAGLFMVGAPALLVHSLSGLTEPMFALVMAISIYLYLSDAIIASIILISFLPFVRSEGLIICGVFAFLLIIEKRFWLLPLLGIGHLVYGVAGVVFRAHNSVLWVITGIPYATLHSSYGSGTWGHFFINLPVFIGLPLFILLVAGMLVGLVSIFKRLKTRQGVREIVLVYGCFCAYFAGHVTFWALGIFNSFGLMRVLIGVLPLMVIIEIRGFNVIDLVPASEVRTIIAGVIITCIITFPFTKCEGAWNCKLNFCLGTEAQLIEMAANYIKANFPEYKSAHYYFDSNYSSVALNLDYFDTTKISRSWQTGDKPFRPGFVIWDDWYSKFENRVSLDGLKINPHLKFIREFKLNEPWGTPRYVDIFETTGN